MPKSKILLLCPLGLALFACAQDTPNGILPTGPTLPLTSAAMQCNTECPITTDVRPFQASRSSPDSLSGRIFLAEVVLSGTRGSTVSLELVGSQNLMSALPPDLRIVVAADGEEQALSMPDLLKARTIYRFQSTSTVHIQYLLTRGAPQSIPIGQIRLTQHTHSADIVSSNRRWIRQPQSFLAQTNITSGCAIAAAFSNVCGINVAVNPFAPPSTFEGTFQSNPGTGASSAIGITFSAAVPSVTVTVYDPTFPGNSAQAFDSAGVLLGTVDFVGTGTPGFDVPDTKTLTFDGIRRVVLIPAQNDYVSYDASFVGTPGPKPCPSPILAGNPPISDPYQAPDTTFRTIPHMGRDYDVPIGTQVFANEAGRVAHSATGTSGGEGIVIRSVDVNSYFFHLSQRLVSVGDTVEAGQLIGLSGNTGHVVSKNGGNGAHLHFEQHTPGPLWNSKHHVPQGTQFAPCTLPGEQN
jgi:murein DD-endopeptidase MepM/ murein hydrolase activator NlpD